MAILSIRKYFFVSFILISVSPAYSFWINHVTINFEYYAERTISATPEGAAQKRCHIQYSGARPLTRFWYVGPFNGKPSYAFACGYPFRYPSFAYVRWFPCALSEHAYSDILEQCVPVEDICGSGGYDYQHGKCTNRNFGTPTCEAQPLAGNPIHANTGNKTQIETDISLSNMPGLVFQRYYNSHENRNHQLPISRKWRSNYDASIEFQNIWGLWRVLVNRPNGNNFILEYLDGEWTGTLGLLGSLRHIEDINGDIAGWIYEESSGLVEKFDINGKLVSRKVPQQQEVNIYYDSYDRIDSVQDASGNALMFQYDQDNRLAQIIDPNGAAYHYTYDINNNLSGVHLPDQTPGDNSDNPRRTYLYEDSRFPSHLTGIIDERGNRVATWAYDDQGRAISSEHADGVDNHSLVYNADGTTTVTDPQGHARTYSFTTQHGLIKVASITGGDCDHCGGDAASYTYDANGYVASKTDFNGNVTT